MKQDPASKENEQTKGKGQGRGTCLSSSPMRSQLAARVYQTRFIVVGRDEEEGEEEQEAGTEVDGSRGAGNARREEERENMRRWRETAKRRKEVERERCRSDKRRASANGGPVFLCC